MQVGDQHEKPLERDPACPFAAQGTHHGLNEDDVVAPDGLMFAQIGCAPHVRECLREPGGELLVNSVHRHEFSRSPRLVA
jgi:hypothetical protein